MKFLYKIHSGYDGFRPAVIPQRMQDGRLRLGWRHYIDVVEKGWECWIYFHGRHRFENGVYVQGIVDDIDLNASEVSLRVRNYSTETPITSREISRIVAEVVAPHYRQVFVWPNDRTVAPECGLVACRDRRCDDCTTWASLPLIEKDHVRPPSRLRWSTYEDMISAHWIVPRRCYEARIAPKVWEISSRFTDFKMGQMAYTYPFARSIYEQICRRDILDFNYVVPIPLSPEKEKKGEMHRTRVLAKELSKLLAVPIRDMLKLTENVSKRRMRSQGHTPAQFENIYFNALEVNIPPDADKILLVDDVMTKGSTVAQALKSIYRQRSETIVVVATAGQMIVKEAVLRDREFRA